MITSIAGELRRVPGGLRNLVIIFLTCGALMILVAVLPFGTHRDFSGRDVTFAQWWASGVGCVVVAIATYLLVVGYGILQRTSWSRPLCLLPFALAFATAPLFPDDSPVQMMLGSGFWLVLLGWYLYRRRSVVSFYARLPESNTA
jgi:hypothetical protein